MILLFNTAYRPGYLKNVLRTIYLPKGATNTYRYSVGADLQITEDAARRFNEQIGQSVLICFGDRYAADGYEFHPLRTGRLIGVNLAGGKAYFKVELDAYVSCDAVSDFTRLLYESDAASGAGMLRLTGGDPLNPHDGRYAVEVSNSCISQALQQSEHSWVASVNGLLKTKAFRESDSKFVFAKCELLVNGNVRGYQRTTGSGWFAVERDDDVRLAISYVFPSQKIDTAAAAKLHISAPPGLQLLSSADHALDMPENKIEIPIAFDGEKKFFTVDVKFSAANTDDEVVGPDDAVTIKVSETGWRKVVALLCVAIYVIGAMCSAADAKVVGELLKVVGLVGIFLVLEGKKIV